MRLIFSIIFGAFIIPNVLCENIIDIFQEIFDLVPKEKIKGIFDKYMVENKQFKEFQEFPLAEKAWIKVQMLQNKEFLDIYKFMEEKSGIPFPAPSLIVESIPPQMLKKPPKPETLDITGRSVNEFIEEVFDALPKDEMSKLMKEKMKTKSQFKTFMDSINSPDFDGLVGKFKNSKDLTETWTIIKSKGLDPDDLHKLILNFIGLAY